MSIESRQAAKQARSELRETLELLSERLDYPARVDAAVSRGKRKLAREQRRNPLAFAAGIVGVSLAVGAAVAGVALAVTRRLQD
ncbi:MAG: DUF3618 domain-containing protein [Canibacter sp.]